MQIHTYLSSLLQKHAFTLGVFGVLFGFTFLAGGFVVANGQTLSPDDSHIVSMYVDGTETIIPTRASTVGELIDKADIKLAPEDLVEPAKETAIDSDNFRISIYKARPVTIVDDDEVTRVLSPHQGAKMVAEKAGVVVYPEDVLELSSGNSFVEEQIIGEKLLIDRATPVVATIFGTPTTLRSQSTTVQDILTEKAIVLTEADRVSVPLETALYEGLQFEIWREGKQTITAEEAVAKTVRQVQDGNKPAGFKEVQSAGKDGKKLVTYEIEIRNGQEFSRKEVASVVTEQPVEEVVVVGTKNNYSGSLNEWLFALRQCESGGIYSRNSGNGFFGAYQFMYSTWNRIATKVGRADLVGVRPDLASPADQDMMIVANTKLSSGGLASQNPGCYKKLGLSQFPPE